MSKYGIASGGVGMPDEVYRPTIVKLKLGDRVIRVAIFTMVAQMCHKKPQTGDDIIEPSYHAIDLDLDLDLDSRRGYYRAFSSR